MRSVMDASVSNLYDEGYLSSRTPLERVCPTLPQYLVLALGVAQILVGLTCLVIQVTAIVIDMDGYYMALGLSFGFPYLLTGALGCAASLKKSVRLINAFKKFCVVSAAFAALLLITYILVLFLVILPRYCDISPPINCTVKLYGISLTLCGMVAAMFTALYAIYICRKAVQSGVRYVGGSGSGNAQLLHLENSTSCQNHSSGRTEGPALVTRDDSAISGLNSSSHHREQLPPDVPGRGRSASQPVATRGVVFSHNGRHDALAVT